MTLGQGDVFRAPKDPVHFSAKAVSSAALDPGSRKNTELGVLSLIHECLDYILETVFSPKHRAQNWFFLLFFVYGTEHAWPTEEYWKWPTRLTEDCSLHYTKTCHKINILYKCKISMWTFKSVNQYDFISIKNNRKQVMKTWKPNKLNTVQQFYGFLLSQFLPLSNKWWRRGGAGGLP